MERFELYYTFNKPTEKDKVGTTASVVKRIGALSVSEQDQLFMLICEHIKNEGVLTELFDTNAIEKYSVTTDGDSVTFDFTKFPKDLKIVVCKFLNFLDRKNS